MSRCLVWLTQAFQLSGTYLGLFVLNSEWSRIFVPRAGEILVETSGAGEEAAMPLREFIESGQERPLAHDLIRKGELGETELTRFWEYAALVRKIVKATPEPLPTTMPRTDGETPTSPQINVVEPGLSLTLLELASRAHPDVFPHWWIEAKRKMIETGKGDEPVGATAYPARQRARDDESAAHTRRWLEQMGTANGTLYTPDEILHDPSCDAYEFPPFDEHDIGLLQAELDGWTVRLVSTSTVDAATGEATSFVT